MKSSSTRCGKILCAPLLTMLLGAASLLGQGESMDAPAAPLPPSLPASPQFLPRVPIAFPPIPPALGAPIPRVPPVGGTLAAPPELAGSINELFYPQLSAQLQARTLSRRLRAELESYRATKNELQIQLRTELERLRTSDAATRQRELAAFAQLQTPKLKELELAAERLRKSLIKGDQDWSAQREWWLGRRVEPAFSPNEIARVMRAHAYYLDGLLPAQRRLLREISLELTIAAESTAQATAAQPHVFFSPEPARVTFPADLPTAVSAKIAQYETKKSALKKELYDEVIEIDGARIRFLSGHTGSAIAARQASGLTSLELLAEEIRQDLAHLVDRVPEIEPTMLPPNLAHRARVMMQSFADAQKAALHQAGEIVTSARQLPITIMFHAGNDGFNHVIRPSSLRSTPSAKTQQQIAAVKNAMAEVAAQYSRRLAELVMEKDAIRNEILAITGKGQVAAADEALAREVRSAILMERNELYREYRLAVFQPGLSPEQRRLLFDGAIERLELALPRSELQPTTRSRKW